MGARDWKERTVERPTMSRSSFSSCENAVIRSRGSPCDLSKPIHRMRQCSALCSHTGGCQDGWLLSSPLPGCSPYVVRGCK